MTADNSTGDLLRVLHNDQIVWWDNETGAVEPVTVDQSEPTMRAELGES